MPPPEFQCFANEANTRIFAAGVAFLTKIGREITLEITAQWIAIRAVNDTTSQFASVTFQLSFFEEYLFVQPADAASITIKLQAQAALHAFRSLRGIDHLRVYFSEQDANQLIVFSFSGKHSVTRMATLQYSDAESLLVDVDRNSYIHSFIARPGMLSRIIDHVHGSDEVSFIAEGSATCEVLQSGNPGDGDGGTRMQVVAAPSKIVFQSYVPIGVDERTVRSNLVTAMSLSSQEFETVSLTPNDDAIAAVVAAAGAGNWDTMNDGTVSVPFATDVTFSLKAFKALLNFTEDRSVVSDEVAMFWNGPSSPVMLTTNGTLVRPFVGTLVLATLDTSVSPPSKILTGAATAAATSLSATAAAAAAPASSALAASKKIVAKLRTSDGARNHTVSPRIIAHTDGVGADYGGDDNDDSASLVGTGSRVVERLFQSTVDTSLASQPLLPQSSGTCGGGDSHYAGFAHLESRTSSHATTREGGDDYAKYPLQTLVAAELEDEEEVDAAAQAFDGDERQHKRNRLGAADPAAGQFLRGGGDSATAAAAATAASNAAKSGASRPAPASARLSAPSLARWGKPAASAATAVSQEEDEFEVEKRNVRRMYASVSAVPERNRFLAAEAATDRSSSLAAAAAEAAEVFTAFDVDGGGTAGEQTVYRGPNISFGLPSGFDKTPFRGPNISFGQPSGVHSSSAVGSSRGAAGTGGSDFSHAQVRAQGPRISIEPAVQQHAAAGRMSIEPAIPRPAAGGHDSYDGDEYDDADDQHMQLSQEL